MSWFKVDDKLTSHRKFLRLGQRYGADARCMALGLWVQCGSWSALNETNGFIPEDISDVFGPVREMSTRTNSDTLDVRKCLVDVGLWSETDDGYQFEGWAEYQPTKEGAEEKRARDRERKRRQRAQDDAVREMSTRTNSDTDSVRGCPAPPTRPDPSRPVPEKDSFNAAVATIEPEVQNEPSNPYPADFLRFYDTYPRHQKKGDALKAFRKAKNRATVQEIVDGAQRLRDDPNREDQYTPLPASWLNADGWEDEPLPQRNAGQKRENSFEAWGQPAGEPLMQDPFIDAEVIEMRRISQ